MSSEKYFKILVGRNDIGGALKRLDILTQEEARMAAAQILMLAHNIDNNVHNIDSNVHNIDSNVHNIDNNVTTVIIGTSSV